MAIACNIQLHQSLCLNPAPQHKQEEGENENKRLEVITSRTASAPQGTVYIKAEDKGQPLLITRGETKPALVRLKGFEKNVLVVLARGKANLKKTIIHCDKGGKKNYCFNY